MSEDQIQSSLKQMEIMLQFRYIYIPDIKYPYKSSCSTLKSPVVYEYI